MVKSLPARGIYGYYSTGEEWIKVSVDADGKVQITSTDLTTILSRIGENDDVANMADSLFAGQEAVWDNIHKHVGMIVADKSSLVAGETTIKTQLEKKYKVTVLDDGDIDSGNADLDIYDVIFVCASVTTMANINNLTALGVPLFTCNPETALTIFRMGDDTDGSGTAWDTGTGQTQINIVDITHEIFIDQSTGNFTVYSESGEVTWIRASDLVAGAIELAEYTGDSTKSTVVVLPYDVADEDGTAAPMPRAYWGAHEPSKWNTATQTLFYNIVDWLIHQGRREVQVQGLGKINQINQKLGTELTNANNLYDYIVTGANEAGAHATITANKIGSVLERLEALMQKDTSPAFDSDADSLEAISAAIAALNDLAQSDILDDATAFSGGDIASIKTETDQLPNWRFEDKLATTPTVDADATASEESLTAGSVTPTFPTGSTRQRALLVATLHVANKSAATHKIGLTLQIQKDGGGYGDVVDLTANPPVSLVNVDGTAATFCIVCDVTTTVDTSAVQYDFKWLVDSDNAGAVNYTSNFVLVIIYSM